MRYFLIGFSCDKDYQFTMGNVVVKLTKYPSNVGARLYVAQKMNVTNICIISVSEMTKEESEIFVSDNPLEY